MIPPMDEMLTDEDEKHIAAAIYLLHKAIALRHTKGNGWPTIHACLRDAAIHCEQARQHWTEDAVMENERISRLLFGSPPGKQPEKSVGD